MSASGQLGAALVEALDDEAIRQLVERLPDAALDRLAERLAGRVTAIDERWLSTAEAARYLGLSTNALHKATARRELPFAQDSPGAKCWFRRSDLDTWRQRRA